MKASDSSHQIAGGTILGIDPGGEITGYGVVRKSGGITRMIACGTSRARPEESLPDKLCRIFNFVRELIDLHQPQFLVVEDIFYGKNVQSLKSIGQVRGVIILAGGLAGVPVHEYSPREVKKAVVGRGDASKEQVQRMVQAVLGLDAPPKPFDAADALALALCHSHRCL